VDQEPLVREQIDAGARFLAEFQKVVPIQSAFWVKESEASDWFLYVASDQITDDNFDVLYGDVLPIAMPLRGPWFDPFSVKLIGSDDPLAKTAATMHQRFPGLIGTHFGGSGVWPPFVERVYLYPSPLPVPAA
jgi:hypothetical protein